MDEGQSAGSTSTGTDSARRPELPGIGLAGSEWPAKVADGVENVVEAVQDRLIRPLLITARAIVFGLVAAAMGLLLLALIGIAAIRVLDVYAFGHRVWPAYALIGAILVVGGGFAWTKRKVPDLKDS
jgi:hypothetical protein